jgi:hypothetical protein
MAARGRRFREAWLFWPMIVVGGCLGFIGLPLAWESFIASWPWSVKRVVPHLIGLAVMVGWLSVNNILIRLAFGDKKWKGRTAKAKEKFADSLMSVSTAVQSAMFIGVLVFPFTAFIQAMASGTDPVAALVTGYGQWLSWLIIYGLFLAPLAWGRMCQRQALDIDDAIARESSPPPTPTVDPIAQGANEQPSSPAGVETTPASANGGSRRRRRHRRKCPPLSHSAIPH